MNSHFAKAVLISICLTPLFAHANEWASTASTMGINKVIICLKASDTVIKSNLPSLNDQQEKMMAQALKKTYITLAQNFNQSQIGATLADVERNFATAPVDQIVNIYGTCKRTAPTDLLTIAYSEVAMGK